MDKMYDYGKGRKTENYQKKYAIQRKETKKNVNENVKQNQKDINIQQTFIIKKPGRQTSR